MGGKGRDIAFWNFALNVMKLIRNFFFQKKQMQFEREIATVDF